MLCLGVISVRLGLRLRLGLGFIFYVYFVSIKPNTALSSCVTHCYVTGNVLTSFQIS